MKEAIWGAGLIMLCIIAFVVIGTVSNTTTTNQQDYEFMKNTVQAAMYDAIDEIRYRRGFCVCPKDKKNSSPIVFTDRNQYTIEDINDTENYCDSGCRFLHGEYSIDADVFTESLVSRFGTVAKTNEEYEIVVQEVIEYPPKATVSIAYKQYVNEMIGDGSSYPIVNRMDAILEGGEVHVTLFTGKGKVQLGKLDCNDALVAGSKLSLTKLDGTVIETWTSSSSAYHEKTLDVGSYILVDNNCNATNTSVCKTTFTVDRNDLSKTQKVVVRTNDIKDCPCTEPKTGDPSPSDPIGSGPGACPWVHLHLYKAVCKGNLAKEVLIDVHQDTPSRENTFTAGDLGTIIATARSKCSSYGYAYIGQKSNQYYYYDVKDKQTGAVLCSRMDSPNSAYAIKNCGPCNGNSHGCVAVCAK